MEEQKIIEKVTKPTDWCSPITVVMKTSPASLIMGRELRTTLPTLEKNLQNQEINPDLVREKDVHNKSRYEYYYNRRHSARTMPVLSPEDKVRIRTDHDKSWSDEKATVLQNMSCPRSYNVQSPDSRVLRRNRKHLQLVPPDTNGIPVRNRQNQNNSVVNQDNSVVNQDNSVVDQNHNNLVITEPVQAVQPVRDEHNQLITENSQNVSHSGQTVTRSGRVVRPRNILNL